MFHVRIEIEQHQNGISTQYKTRDYNRKIDVLFSTENEKAQFLDLFQRGFKPSKPITNHVLPSQVKNLNFHKNFVLYWLYVFYVRKQKMIYQERPHLYQESPQ